VLVRAIVCVGLVLSSCSNSEKPKAPAQSAEAAPGPRRVDELSSLPYLNNLTTRSAAQRAAPGKFGVLRFDRARAWPGYGLYNNHYRNRAVLIDMEGKPVHSWQSRAGQDAVERTGRWGVPPYLGWHHVEMDTNGTLFAIVGYPPMPEGGVLIALDWKSKPLWKLPIGAHHDIALGDDGALYTLSFDLVPLEHRGARYVLERERLVRVDKQEGKVVDTISFNELLSEHPVLGPLLKKKKAKLAKKCARAIAERGKLRRMVFRRILFLQLDLHAIGRVLTHDGLVEAKVPARMKSELDALSALFLEATISKAKRKRFRKRFNALVERFIANPPAATAKRVDAWVDRLYSHLEANKGLRKADKEALHMLAHICQANAIHSNTIEVIEADRAGLWKAGDLLTSFRQLDTLAVVRPHGKGKAEIVWYMGPGTISRQHQPSLTAKGNILVFDNGVDKRRSRVVEIDPRTKKVVWSYGDRRGDKRFYSWWKGGAEELPNGNVLIANTVTGEIFEVTKKDRKIVWYFVAHADSGGEVAQVYRFTRLPEAMVRAIDPKLRGPVKEDE
jgi:hypothetical protein